MSCKVDLVGPHEPRLRVHVIVPEATNIHLLLKVPYLELRLYISEYSKSYVTLIYSHNGGWGVPNVGASSNASAYKISTLANHIDEYSFTFTSILLNHTNTSYASDDVTRQQ